MVTSTARAEHCWSDEEISQMRMELRDQYYEKIKYGNRPLPTLPPGKTHSAGLIKFRNTAVQSDDGSSAPDREATNLEEAAEIRAQLKE